MFVLLLFKQHLLLWMKKLACKKQSTEYLKRERWAPKSWCFRKLLFRFIQGVILLNDSWEPDSSRKTRLVKVWESSVEVPGDATNKLGVVAKKADVYLILELWKEIPERVVELFIACYYFLTLYWIALI